MPTIGVNGNRLDYERQGSGDPLVLVHGSWVDQRSWNALVPLLARRFLVVTYDRRGHGRSVEDPGTGSAREDVEDLAALIENLDLAPAHVVGNSFGGSITLFLATHRPDLLKGLSVHEPPLFGLLADDPESQAVLGEVGERIATIVKILETGDRERAAERFVEEVALGPGSWEGELTEELRGMFVQNAHTFVSENRDPANFAIDLRPLTGFPKPALVTMGDRSPTLLVRVAELIAGALPGWGRATIPGAGHVPQVSHPAEYADLLVDFLVREHARPVA